MQQWITSLEWYLARTLWWQHIFEGTVKQRNVPKKEICTTNSRAEQQLQKSFLPLNSAFKLNCFVSQCLQTTGALPMSVFIPVSRKVAAICSHLGEQMDLRWTTLFFNQGGELFGVVSSDFTIVISAGCTGTASGQEGSPGLAWCIKGSVPDTRSGVLLLCVCTHLSLG